MTTVTLAAHHGPVGRGRASYRAAVRSEWTKFWTLRSTVVLVGVLGAAFPILAVIVAATESLQPDDTILGASVLGGAVMAQLLAGVLGALLVTGEYKSGMIRATLAANPRRAVVVAAKATVAALSTAAITLPSAIAAYTAGRLLLDTDTYATGDLFPGVLGVSAAIASLAALGVALGTLVRHAAGAIVAVVALVLLPGMVAPLLGDLQRWVGGASVDAVMQKLLQSSDATHETVGRLGGWASLIVVAGLTAVTLAAAARVMRHRDT